VLQTEVAELTLRIAALEAGADPGEQLDGAAPQPLAPHWKALKAACADLGLSQSGLRKAIRRHADGPRWWQFRGGRLFINVHIAPRRRVRT
jgi:hypothetical protein